MLCIYSFSAVNGKIASNCRIRFELYFEDIIRSELVLFVQIKLFYDERNKVYSAYSIYSRECFVLLWCTDVVKSEYLSYWPQVKFFLPSKKMNSLFPLSMLISSLACLAFQVLPICKLIYIQAVSVVYISSVLNTGVSSK